MAARAANHGPAHPGVHIRQNVIPKGMTVTKAASLLGVGRPALSNLLHGKSALSQEMALRLQQTFGADREDLLDRQAQYDRRDDALKGPIVSGRHVPALAEIKAQQIEQWSDTTRAREELPALLRRLVCATLGGITRVDFPAFDNAQRPGWDGVVETATPSPWVPKGRSRWELGCGRGAEGKANSDYAKSAERVPPAERLESAFVFVTPRNWRRKDEWAAEKAALGEWKSVRAYDASDLEQWLEQSAETQVWFAERLGFPVDGFRSPDQCWSNWADACKPALPVSLFSIAEGNAAKLKELKEWLDAPSERPFIVVADSPQEALAFACNSISKIGKGEPGTSALVVDTPEAMRRFSSTNSAPKIAIIHDSEVEKEIGSLYCGCHCLIVRPVSNLDPEIEPDIKLELPTWADFSASLKSMGYNQDEIDHLARQSGRSPTVLRRRLSNIPAVREPAWAGTAEIARKLLPTALVGAWNETHTADCKVVRKLAQNKKYKKIEAGISELLSLPESPLWSIRDYRGVVSRIDALFGIAEFVTKSDLETLFSCAERVLKERDPALDLPEDQRWVAAVHGKVRIHSNPLRKGISDTLVLLSVYGNGLFQKRLGIDVASWVSSSVRKLLEPFTIDNLLSQNRLLPLYAEAAPEQFLQLIEADLRQPEPIVFGFLKPAKYPLFGGCPRTGLLWALEFLAWKNVARASRILARLSEVEISDYRGQTPFASLKGIHLSWMPQTAASLEERLFALEELTKEFPEIGWRLCMEQLKSDFQTASHNYRPRWSDDASGAGQVTTCGEHEVRQKALCLALNRPDHDPDSLGDLIEHLAAMRSGSQIAVWNLIDRWAAAEADDPAKAKLRERIRRYVPFRHELPQGLNSSTTDRAYAACANLEPGDLVVRHAWLFADHWVHYSADEIIDNDPGKHEETVRELRSSAIREILRERGVDGAMALLPGSRSSHVVGSYLGRSIETTESLALILERCLSIAEELQKKADECMEGLLSSVDDKTCCKLLGTVADGGNTDQIARLFRCAPARKSTWRLLDQYGKDALSLYWQKVVPPWHIHDDADLNEMIRYLLDSMRPRAAFNAAHFGWSRIRTELLVRLLEDVGTVDVEPHSEYLLDRHEISDALETLDGRPGVTPDIMENLELLFVEALGERTRGIPNLERKIARSPEFFVQILAGFDRDDHQMDPPEIRIDNQERRKALVSKVIRLFGQISHIPGIGANGKVDTEALQNWVSEARRLCAEFGRTKVGDRYIGGLLSKAPADADGLWPCKAVCDVMENTASQDIGWHFTIGVRNQRGVYSRAIGEGGAQERELAKKYRHWAKQRRIEYPYVGCVLESIAASYDRDAAKEDDRAKVDRRLRC